MSVKRHFLRLVRLSFYMALLMVLITAVGVAVIYAHFMPQLPSTDSLREVQLQVPLRVYTQDEKLIAEFGEQRRMPLQAREIPQTMIHAVLAAEDSRFFEHRGVDVKGLTVLRSICFLRANCRKAEAPSRCSRTELFFNA
jgi:penicillin-binding protein 1A